MWGGNSGVRASFPFRQLAACGTVIGWLEAISRQLTAERPLPTKEDIHESSCEVQGREAGTKRSTHQLTSDAVDMHVDLLHKLGMYDATGA